MELTAADIKGVIDGLAKKETVDTLLGKIEGIDAKLADLGKPPEPEKPEPEAKMEAKGWFDGIMSFEIQGIPVGQAAVGGFAAIVLSELIDGFASDMKDWQRGLIKLGVAAIAAKWGGRILGSTGSKAVALLLTFDAIRDFTPIDTWADTIAEKITGKATTAGLAGNQTQINKANAAAKQPKQTGYYAMALGGG
jgi:hypothetical protein